MKNDIKEMRCFIDDIRTNLTESYHFNEENENSENTEENVEQNSKYEDSHSETMENQSDITETIKSLRKIAIKALSDLDPTTNEADYKTLKSIWDICDKSLAKPTVKNETELN